MFGKGKSKATKKFEQEKIDTIVSSGISIEGKITSKGNVRFDCKIDGDIEAESLFIGKDGYVKGSVNCENIIVSGRIDGDVSCKGKMHIKETGIIDGDINVNLLSMEEGAVFTGKCIKEGVKKKDSSFEIKTRQEKVDKKKNDVLQKN